MRILCFYEDDELECIPELIRATTYRQLNERLYKTTILHTNESSALNFDYFSYYDVIQIHAHNRTLMFYKPDNELGIIKHNTSHQKELRVSHNLRKLWIAGYFE